MSEPLEAAVSEYAFLTYETTDEGTIAVISLNRPGARNAQNRGMLVELGTAFQAAEADDQVRVVVLRGNGAALLLRARHGLLGP